MAYEVSATAPRDQEPVFSVGDTIAFRLALGPAGSGTVVSVNQAVCDFAFDGDTWRMSAKRDDETGGDPEAAPQFSEWVIRERLGV